MYTHKTIIYSREGLIEMEELGKQGYRLCTIYDGKIFLEKEEKKPVKSRALTTESNKSIQYLKMQRERIDTNQEIHCPDFIDNKEKWYEFVHHWTQRNSDGGKLHCEKEKTFEIRGRWATWRKDKKEINNIFNKIG